MALGVARLKRQRSIAEDLQIRACAIVSMWYIKRTINLHYYKGHNMTTHKILTASAIRDSKGRFTGSYSFGFNWLVLANAIAGNSKRRLPVVWCALQLAVLAIVASQLGVY